MTLYLQIAVAALAVTVVLTGLVRRYAVEQSLIDVPNERSSHSMPTPRGGGLAIVLVVIGGITLLATTGRLPQTTGMALAGGGALVASIGWLDDRRSVPAWMRFAVHALAAVWAVGWLGGMPFVTTGADRPYLGIGGSILAVSAVIWAINLYNFMDGIDGLAAVEAVTTGLLGAVLLDARSPGLAAVSVLVAATATGFLPWNWSPARIFMGDIGSGFLGFIFGALAAASETSQALPALMWVVLLGVFFADATITLVRRMARRERWYSAHRSHAYQRAAQSGWSHRRIALAVLGLNLALGLAARWAMGKPELLFPLLAAAGVVLGVIYLLVERRAPHAGVR